MQTAEKYALDYCDGDQAAVGGWSYPDEKSPDGAWQVRQCIDSQEYSYLKFSQVNGNVNWKVSLYKIFISKLKSDDHPEAFKDEKLFIGRWSIDGKYVYIGITSDWQPKNERTFGYLGTQVAFYQLDLNTGKSRNMIPPGSTLGFSGDDKYLMYGTLPATVHLRNLQNDDEKSFSISSKYTYLGRFSWSPDNTKVFFIAWLKDSHKNLFGPTPINKSGSSVLLFDLKTMKVTTLIDNDIRMLVPLEESGSYAWMNNNSFYLSSVYAASPADGKAYRYDVAEKKLILTKIVYPTPTPTPAP